MNFPYASCDTYINSFNTHNIKKKVSCSHFRDMKIEAKVKAGTQKLGLFSPPCWEFISFKQIPHQLIPNTRYSPFEVKNCVLLKGQSSWKDNKEAQSSENIQDWHILVRVGTAQVKHTGRSSENSGIHKRATALLRENRVERKGSVLKEWKHQRRPTKKI